MSEKWTKFTRNRIESYNQQRARHLRVHGQDVVNSLIAFYSFIDRYFTNKKCFAIQIFSTSKVIQEKARKYSFLNTLHFGKIKYDDDNKFTILHNSIINNIFIEESRKKYFIDAFFESQKIYRGFFL